MKRNLLALAALVMIVLGQSAFAETGKAKLANKDAANSEATVASSAAGTTSSSTAIVKKTAHKKHHGVKKQNKVVNKHEDKQKP